MWILAIIAATGFAIGRLFNAFTLFVMVFGLIAAVAISHLAKGTELQGDLVLLAVDLLCLQGFFLLGALWGWPESRAG